MVPFCDVAAQRSACRKKRHPHGPRLQRQGDREIGEIKNLHPVLFHSASKVVRRSHHHVAHPGSDHFFDATGANQLIKQNVRDRSDQSEVTFFLAGDLVSGGKWNHLLQLQAECDAGTVGHEVGDRRTHCEKLRHELAAIACL